MTGKSMFDNKYGIIVILFFVSGFSGLIYESIWAQYLKLYLGHASYAQTLVLVIFMGGMSMGSAMAARLSARLKNLLFCYAVIELCVGVFAIVFHDLFVFVDNATYEYLFASESIESMRNVIKWSIAGLLIMPQSILLGATFPMIVGGVLRRNSTDPGKKVAILYFVNSLGASIGVLSNTFILIPKLGLPGSILTAGLLNIVIAGVIYFVSKGESFRAISAQRKTALIKIPDSKFIILIIVAALTGAASFMYEIAWIRMLTMVLGGSTHAFEIMLSAFIFGLAIGGWAIRDVVDRINNKYILLGCIQLAMGFLAIITIPIYNSMYEFMDFFIKSLKANDEGYILYNIVNYY